MKIRSQGFTLVELAIVIVIIGLLLGGGLTVVGAQIENQRIKDSQALLDQAKEALIGYAIANGRFPRPATSAANGAENASACATEAACTGFIPWQTLGIAKLDAWSKIIRYSVTPAYANATFTMTTTATRNVQTRDAGGALVSLAGPEPAVIWSHGKYRWGTSDAGAALADGSGTNTDEDTNNTGPTTFVSRTWTDNTAASGGEFDDLVVWVPRTILLGRMVQAAKLP